MKWSLETSILWNCTYKIICLVCKLPEISISLRQEIDTSYFYVRVFVHWFAKPVPSTVNQFQKWIRKFLRYCRESTQDWDYSSASWLASWLERLTSDQEDRSLNPLCGQFIVQWHRDRRHITTAYPYPGCLKGPKREIFGFGIFAQIRPIWIG